MIMSNNKYIRVCTSVHDKGRLIKKEDLEKILQRPNIEQLYESTYYYNEDHYKEFQTKKSVAGVRNVKTDKIWFDFDQKDNPELSRKDAITLVKRLQESGIKDSAIQVYFSGMKGINVIVQLKNDLNPIQVAKICSNLAKDLETFDTTLYDSTQILRVPATKHQITKNYKIPISVDELNNLTIDQMRDKSSKANKDDIINSMTKWEVETLPEKLNVSAEETKLDQVRKTEVPKFDLTNKPKEWKDYKWALLNAYMVKPEERHQSLMVVAATCRSLGYTEEYARAMCLVFDDKFTTLTNKPPVEDLDNNILKTVYSPTWNGGSYSFKNNIFLQQYSERIGIKAEEDEEVTITIDSAFDLFKDYAINIDKLTVKTGIPDLDKNLRMTIGMSVGLVAAPGVGKSSLALQILNSMSKTNEQSIFFSYDMYHALVFQKLIQKHLRISDKEIFNKFKSNDIDFQKKVLDTLKKEYSNVEFCFKTGQTPSDIEETIKYTQQKTGKKPRLAIVDYSELVLTDKQDMTAGSAEVAQKLREIATKYNICIFVLLQPNKMAGSPADELKSYRSLKGSSSAEQALSIILGMSRPGYDPRNPEHDQFITIKCLKNRMGPLFTLDLGWKGDTGDIYQLSDEQEELLKKIREAKEKEESGDSDGWN